MTPVVVIPVYNEAAALEAVVTGARWHAPVIVVDDGSSDGSGDVAARAGAEVIRHRRRQGKAAALRSGIARARQRGATVVVTLDGDGQHAPEDLSFLLGAARENPDRIIVGNRLTQVERFPRGRLNAMRVAGFFIEWVSALGVRDTQSGFRVYPMALLDDVPLSGQGFLLETEVLIAAARRGWRAREIPVTSIPSARRPSRFRPLGDGIAIGAYLARQSLARWRQEMATVCRGLGRWLARRGGGDGLGGDHARRTGLVAAATVSTPLLLAAAVVQAALGRHGPDMLTPLVRSLYSAERLVDLADEGEPTPATMSPGTLVTSPARRP